MNGIPQETAIGTHGFVRHRIEEATNIEISPTEK